ncbi:MAG TPA: DUF6495 family protein [Saprospiraceae bacterium]|nr:DUF6495 family protein [Saprospiraceae bacterium]HPN69848.1 DUF6495 family protein [Saprospiraceae bacterium]
MHPIKYRRLSIEELTHLEEKFIQFLVVNGISAEDWVKIKSENLDQTNDLIDSFSDTIFEGLMQKTTFFEYADSKMILSYKVDDKKAICYILMIKADSNLVIDPEKPEASIAGISPDDFTLTVASKEIQGDRNLFVYQELEKGRYISDGKLFDFFSKLNDQPI